jgi:hypothetical protein
VIGGREKFDGPHGHITGPGWDSHLPADHSFDKQGLQIACRFNIIILWLRKTNKAEFYFPGNTLTVSKNFPNSSGCGIFENIQELPRQSTVQLANYKFISLSTSISPLLGTLQPETGSIRFVWSSVCRNSDLHP